MDNIQPQNQLQLIESMIQKARNDFQESGTLYLMWGFVLLFCSLVQFIGLYFYSSNWSFIWMLTWVTVIAQIFILRKQKKKQGARSYTDEIMGAIWIVFFICMVLLAYILGSQKAFPSILPVILVMYGIPTFLSGTLIKFNLLKWGGVGCWVLAILCSLTPLNFQILFIGAAVIIAWIIPGIFLRKRFRNEKFKTEGPF
jgi:hypothetical protein